MIELTTLLLLIQLGLISCSQYNLNLLMPNVSPKNKDTYLCYKFKVDQDQTFITKFRPNATKEIAHHMLLFGCSDVGDQEVWNCGEMATKTGSVQDNYVQHGVCKDSKQSIIYAWAMNAPELSLPKDGGTDNSGVILTAQDEPVQNVAGVYFIGTGGNIAPHSIGHFEAACQLQEELPFYPFAFRAHAHNLGLVNSGYVIKTDPLTGEQSWIEIGRRSPQLPQIFYHATNQIELNKGDILAARCTMNNYLDRIVEIGSTADDEMCNFYIMYYTKGDRVLENDSCWSPGPPEWSFGDFETLNGKRLDLSKIPDDISKVPMDQENGMSHMHGMAHGRKK